MYGKLGSVAFAAVFLIGTIEPARPEGARLGFPDHAFGPKVDGTSARVQFRMPFGGPDERTQPTLTLNMGPIWQAQSASPLLPGTLYHSSAVALGFTLSGQPVFKLGELDLVDLKPRRLGAEEGSDHTLRNVVLGFAAAAAIWGVILGSWVHEVCENRPEPEPGDPSCP